ncbi:MAG TPA: patatin-like phospholipase family protein, partial [Cytophagaceae bacterium]
MKKQRYIESHISSFYYSFPIQLLVNNFKKNQILLMLWLLLFAIILQQTGNVLGIPYLFLDPEYGNKVDYKGFLIIGIALGIFITSFHITTYILDSYRFNFLGTIRRPFTKFCFNNSIIPVGFIMTYIICIIKFQFNSGFQSGWLITT